MAKSAERAQFVPGRGYSKADWEEVSDNLELSREEIARAKPFTEAFPHLAESIKHARAGSKATGPK